MMGKTGQFLVFGKIWYISWHISSQLQVLIVFHSSLHCHVRLINHTAWNQISYDKSKVHFQPSKNLFKGFKRRFGKVSKSWNM